MRLSKEKTHNNASETIVSPHMVSFRPRKYEGHFAKGFLYPISSRQLFFVIEFELKTAHETWVGKLSIVSGNTWRKRGPSFLWNQNQ